MHTDEIERVTLSDWRAGSPRWRGERAVVVAGAFTDTTAVRTWTPDSLAERFATVEVNAKYVPWESWSDWSLETVEPMPLRRFVAILHDGGSCRIAQQPLEPFAGLSGELDLPRMAEPPFARVNLWLGNRTRTPLHFDTAENVFVQVEGTKQVVVEPPDSPAGRYLQDGPRPHISLVDPLAPDPERFPEYDAAHQRRALLGPGDALYLPPGWFHDVTALDTSISVNCWFGRRLHRAA